MENYLIPFINDVHGTSYVYQQDNAPIHTSNETKQWFQRNGITPMPWPSCSPDLSHIESLWGILSRRVYHHGKQYNNVPELKKAVLKEWDKLDCDIRYDLAQSMRDRCVELLVKQGGSTKY